MFYLFKKPKIARYRLEKKKNKKISFKSFKELLSLFIIKFSLVILKKSF